MKMLDEILRLINEFYAKHKQYPTTVYVGPEYRSELDELEIKHRLNNPLSKYRQKKIIRGKKIKRPKLYGLKYHRSCLKTTVCSWKLPLAMIQ